MDHHKDGFLKIFFDDISNDSDRKKILPFANSELYHTHIKDAIKLTEGEDVKNVYDIALDTKEIFYNFQPGDTIGILPNNNVEEVLKIFEYLDCSEIVDKNCRIILTEEKKKRLVSHIPVNSTLKDIFLKNVDIRSPPKKAFLKILARYTENIEEKRALENLSLPTNSEDYISFISDNGRSLLNLLQTFPSCKVSVEKLLENLPPLQPRPYSISSSPLIQHEIHITFSIEYFDKETKGVCTGWLENIIAPILSKNKSFQSDQDSTVNFYFRKPNSFQLSPNILTPVIMIGPGTGIAPFIGFLQHLHLQKRTLYTWLFYGCRYSDRDYLYKNHLETYLKENCLTKLSVAFSREQTKKNYVQDLIKTEGAEFYQKLVRENAILYVCGDIKDMMKDVRESIKSCLIDNNMSTEDAHLFISNMIKTNKYIEDKWI